jgi:hypothetical protein
MTKRKTTSDPAAAWRKAQVVPRPELRNQRCRVCGVRVPVKPYGRPKQLCYDHELAHNKEYNRQKALRHYRRKKARERRHEDTE